MLIQNFHGPFDLITAVNDYVTFQWTVILQQLSYFLLKENDRERVGASKYLLLFSLSDYQPMTYA